MYFFHDIYAQLKASGKNICDVKDTVVMSNWNVVKSAHKKSVSDADNLQNQYNTVDHVLFTCSKHSKSTFLLESEMASSFKLLHQCDTESSNGKISVKPFRVVLFGFLCVASTNVVLGSNM